MDVRQAVHQHAECRRGWRCASSAGASSAAAPRASSASIRPRRIADVREMVDAEVDEGVEDAGDESARGRSRQHAPENERAVAAEGEAEQEGDVVDRQRREAEEGRTAAQRCAMPKRFSLYASGYLLGIENVGVVDVRRRVGDAVEVPVEDPGVEQRIAEVGDGGVEADGDGPGEDDGEEEEEAEGAGFAKKADSERMRIVRRDSRKTRMTFGARE